MSTNQKKTKVFSAQQRVDTTSNRCANATNWCAHSRSSNPRCPCTSASHMAWNRWQNHHPGPRDVAFQTPETWWKMGKHMPKNSPQPADPTPNGVVIPWGVLLGKSENVYRCFVKKIKLLFQENTEISKVHFCMLLVPIPGVPIPCGLQKYFVVILDFTGHKSLVSDVEIPWGVPMPAMGVPLPTRDPTATVSAGQLLRPRSPSEIATTFLPPFWVLQNSHASIGRQILSNAPIPPIGVPMPASLSKKQGKETGNTAIFSPRLQSSRSSESSHGVPVPELPRPPTGVDEPPPLLDHPVSWPSWWSFHPVSPTENPLPAGNFVSVGGRVYLSANQRNEKLTLAKNCNGNGVFPSGQMRISPLSWLIWTSVPPTPSENPRLVATGIRKDAEKSWKFKLSSFSTWLGGQVVIETFKTTQTSPLDTQTPGRAVVWVLRKLSWCRSPEAETDH